MHRLVALLSLPLVLLVGLVVVVVPMASSQPSLGTCAIPIGEQRTESLTAEQLSNARIIVGVGLQRRLPVRAAVIALATAQQESRMRNLTYGDRDSLGLFQQRPSAGWGSPRQILDPIYASDRFYDALAKIPGWQSMPLTRAAQAVQRSAFPNAYAQWETLATSVVASITGIEGAAEECHVDDDASVPDVAAPGPWPPEVMGADGLTPRTRTVMNEVRNAFGVTNIGGFCPGGCRSGHITNSDHYTGHAVDFMLTPINDRNRRLGDAITAWLVANADRLAVKYVVWKERIWSRTRASEGWRGYVHPSGVTNNNTLTHRDHVHLSVH